MPKLQKILFPVDFSDSCIAVAKHVLHFARHFAAETTLLHAVGTLERPGTRRELAKAKTTLSDFLLKELPDLNAQQICVAGDPATAIVDTGKSWEPDIVMMPTRGRGDYRRHLLGSVTAKVLHDLSCPVWTSVHAECIPATNATCRRILCAVDLKDRSAEILAWAAWLARACGATLGVAHAMASVAPSPVSRHTDPELGDLGSAYERYISERAQQGLSALRAQAHSEAEEFIEAGSPLLVVPDVASRFNADLVVIGRRSNEAVAHDAFHDAAALVRQMPCPVISM